MFESSPTCIASAPQAGLPTSNIVLRLPPHCPVIPEELSDHEQDVRLLRYRHEGSGSSGTLNCFPLATKTAPDDRNSTGTGIQ